MVASHIYQIFYDETSRAALDPGFVPLDNTANPRPDWFEFHVIKSFLEQHQLDPDAWYGFLSPRFTQKTGFAAGQVQQLVQQAQQHGCDMAYINVWWEQMAYFLNPFEQGDYFHPGLSAIMQDFLQDCGIALNLGQLVTHTQNYSYCNYLIAKPAYWQAWLQLATQFEQYVQRQAGQQGAAAAQDTYYLHGPAPMKTFVQERFPVVLAALHGFRSLALEDPAGFAIKTTNFVDTPYARGLLQTCNWCKMRYLQTGDQVWLDMFFRLRAECGPKAA